MAITGTQFVTLLFLAVVAVTCADGKIGTPSTPQMGMMGGTGSQPTTPNSGTPGTPRMFTMGGAGTQSAIKTAKKMEMEMTPFQKLLQKLKMEKKPEVPKCEMDDVDVYCGELRGIYYKWDDGDFHQVYSSKMLPFKVDDGKKLLVAVCNFGNYEFRPYFGYLQLPLLPALIGDVGEKAKVSLQIKNSANIESYGNILLESELGPGYKPKTLIPSLVVGKVSEDATIGVKIMNSGNVKLNKEVNKLLSKNNVFVSSLITPSNEKCIEKACFSIEVEGVGNILAKNESEVEVGLDYSTMVAPLFKAKCSEEVTVRAEVKNTACVLGAKKLEMERKSYAINPVVTIEEAEDSKFMVEIEESGNMHLTDELELKESALLMGGLVVKEGKELMAKVSIDGSANVISKEVKLEKSSIIMDAITAIDSKMGIIGASIENSANIMAKEAVILEGESKVIGCGLKLGDGPTLLLNIAKMDMSGNIRAGKVQIKDESALIYKIIGSKEANSTAFLAKIKGCGNIATTEETVMDKSCLIDDLVDIEDAKGPFKAQIVAEYVANVLCGKGYEPKLKLKDSKLVSAALEASTELKDPLLINADMKLGVLGNSFVKTEDAEKLVEDVFDQSKTGADHISIMQKSVGKMMQCSMD